MKCEDKFRKQQIDIIRSTFKKMGCKVIYNRGSLQVNINNFIITLSRDGYWTGKAIGKTIEFKIPYTRPSHFIQWFAYHCLDADLKGFNNWIETTIKNGHKVNIFR